MVALADLAPASFKGARFLVPRDHVAHGRNAIEHKVPGANLHFVEDNGAQIRELHLTMYLSGVSLMSDWSRLQTALNSAGPGTLNHPWLGSLFCQVKGPVQTKRDDKDSGVLEIVATFCETIGGTASAGVNISGVIPASIASGAANVIALAIGAMATSMPTVASAYSQSIVLDTLNSVTMTIAGNFPSTTAVATAVDSLSSASMPSLISTLPVNQVAASLYTFGQQSFQAHMAPLPAMYALYQAPADDSSVSNIDLTNGYMATFDVLALYATIVDGIDPTTYDLSIRQQASDLLVTTMMACTFAAILEGMAAKAKASDYATANDVDDDLTSLATMWATLADRSLDATVRQKLSVLYTGLVSILQKLEVTLPHVGTLDAPVVPASVLSYWLYDTDADETTLIGLNPNLLPMLYDGPVEVLIGN